VLTPGTSFYGGLGRHAPARSLIEAGAAVALASGFAPDQSPTYNMQTVIALACREMKMTPAEAICAATVNAAYAIGCGDSVGTLEQGRAADLILLNISDYRELPYYFGMNHVHMTMKRGVVIYGEDRAR
jgi:imidazolonepropionase